MSEHANLSRSQIQKRIKAGQISINGVAVVKVGQELSDGDVIVFEEKKISTQLKEKKKEVAAIPRIPILNETDDYLIVNKPAGLLVHPTEREEPNTLVAWLLKQYPNISAVGDKPSIRPGIVHRLDKDVSGVMVVAKTQAMFDHLKKQFKNRTVEKDYTVLVYGAPERDHGTIDFPIDRGKDGRMAARPKVEKVTLKTIKHIQPGKPARTEFWVRERFPRFTLLNVRIHTGRTHQIRVHLFALDHPVVGDKLYSNKKLIKKHDRPLERIFLHAHTLCFTDLKKKNVCFEAKLPHLLETFLKTLR